MGIVEIGGTCAAVNALLASVSRIMTGAAGGGMIPAALVKVKGRRVIPPALLGAGIFGMLGAGMAGSPILEQFSLAAWWFWIASYGALHLSFQLAGSAARRREQGLRGRLLRVLSLGSLLFIGWALVSVFPLLERTEAMRLAGIIAAISLSCAVCSAFMVRFER